MLRLRAAGNRAVAQLARRRPRARPALERAVRFRRPGEYQLQAAITALHIQGSDVGTTDWGQIAELYGALAKLTPTPVVEVNRAAAVGFAAGPETGLELLEPLLANPALERYPPLYATHAELLKRSGDLAGARRACARAIALSANAVERAELERRIKALKAKLNPRPVHDFVSAHGQALSKSSPRLRRCT